MSSVKQLFMVVIAMMAFAACAGPAACAQAQTGGAAACALTPDPGPCKGLFEKYFFDAKTGTCRSFFYGGCEGVVPFETIDDCRAACEQAGDVVLSYRTSEDPAPAMFLDVMYPKDWENLEEPEITITVNGEPARARSIGGGFDTEKQSVTFWLAPGAAGHKTIEATVKAGGKSGDARTNVFWEAVPVLKILDLGGAQEAVLAPGAVRLLAFQLKDVRMSFNGAAVDFKAERSDPDLGDVLSVSPAWKPGLNTLSVQAKDNNNADVRAEYTLVNMAGDLAMGQTAVFTYGEVGTKSGPFFRVEADGAALSLKDDKFGVVYALDDEGWLVPRQILQVALVPQAPGKSTLRIFKKEHFTQGENPLREIPVTVSGK